MPDLAEKDSFDDLTPKQQSVVDALVENPTAQNTEIAEETGVSRSTVYNVKEQYGHIVEARLNDRGRDPGEARTEGDPFASLDDVLDSDDAGVQYIGERPRQGDAGETPPTGELAVTLTRGDIEAILQSGCVPEDFRSEVVARVVGLAFSDDE